MGEFEKHISFHIHKGEHLINDLSVCLSFFLFFVLSESEHFPETGA